MIGTMQSYAPSVWIDRVRRPMAAIRLAVVLTEDERRRRIAYAIRRAREARGKTPPEIAEAVGVGRGTVNDWEAGRSTPSLVHLGPLCLALGVDPQLFAALPAIPEDPLAAFYLQNDETAAAGTRRRRSVTSSVTRRDADELAVAELEAEAARTARQSLEPSHRPPAEEGSRNGRRASVPADRHPSDRPRP